MDECALEQRKSETKACEVVLGGSVVVSCLGSCRSADVWNGVRYHRAAWLERGRYGAADVVRSSSCALYRLVLLERQVTFSCMTVL